MARAAPTRSPVLLLVLGLLLLLGLLASAGASIRPAVCGRESSSSLRYPPPLFIVGPPHRAGWVTGLAAGVGGRWGRTTWLGARKRKLPDDPSELQRLLEQRETELKLTKMQLEIAEVRLEERVAAKAAEVEKMEARLEAAELKRKVENAALASSNTQLLRYKHQLTIRSVIEIVERTLSPQKARNPSLSREETWLDIFEREPELEAQVRAISGAKDTKGAVRVIQNLCKLLSGEIHNPDAVDVPVPLGLLSFVNAAVAVLLCRTLPIKYHILLTDNEDLGGGYTPEQVKRGEFGGLA